MSGNDVNGKLDTLIAKVENIETLLVGDVKNTGKVGVLERIRKIEKWIDKREWFEKVVIVAIVGNAIAAIFLLIQSLSP
jgi:hypothetical protein